MSAKANLLTRESVQPDTAQKYILVSCTGNLFRSPMAAAFIQRLLDRANLKEQIIVSSAGLRALADREAPHMVTEHMLSAYDLDLSEHRTRPLTPGLFQRADLILVMEQAQLMRLAQQYPRQTCKLRLISELGGSANDIKDVGDDPSADVPFLAEQLHRLIEPNLNTLLGWLKITLE